MWCDKFAGGVHFSSPLLERSFLASGSDVHGVIPFYIDSKKAFRERKNHVNLRLIVSSVLCIKIGSIISQLQAVSISNHLFWFHMHKCFVVFYILRCKLMLDNICNICRQCLFQKDIANWETFAEISVFLLSNIFTTSGKSFAWMSRQANFYLEIRLF